MPTSRNVVELTRKAVDAVGNHTSAGAYRWIFVIHEDDASEFAWLPDAIVVKHNLDPYTCPRGNNLGLRAAGVGADVVFLNGDTEVTAGWLDKLIEDSAGNALTMARTQYKGSGNPEAWGEGPARDTRARSGCSFFCCYLPWRIRRVLGTLDEEYEGYGGEDTDYTMRAILAGFGARISSAFVWHREPGSDFRHRDGDKIDRAAEHWRAKWGVAPWDVAAAVDAARGA